MWCARNSSDYLAAIPEIRPAVRCSVIQLLSFVSILYPRRRTERICVLIVEFSIDPLPYFSRTGRILYMYIVQQCSVMPSMPDAGFNNCAICAFSHLITKQTTSSFSCFLFLKADRHQLCETQSASKFTERGGSSADFNFQLNLVLSPSCQPFNTTLPPTDQCIHNSADSVRTQSALLSFFVHLGQLDPPPEWRILQLQGGCSCLFTLPQCGKNEPASV